MQTLTFTIWQLDSAYRNLKYKSCKRYYNKIKINVFLLQMTGQPLCSNSTTVKNRELGVKMGAMEKI